MGQQIIKQPNGLYCIFNSIAGGITYTDLTPRQILEVWVGEYRDRATVKLMALLEKIDAGQPAYHQFTMSFDAALARTAEQFGEQEKQEILDGLESEREAQMRLRVAPKLELPEEDEDE
jgi:hypothetical protein